MKNTVTIIAFTLCTNFLSAQWVQQISGTVDDLAGASFPTANVGYISANSYLLKTTNGGSSWNSIPCACYAPCFTSVDTGYVSAAAGILKTVDGGATWIDNFPYSNIGIGNIYFVTTNLGYAIGQNFSFDSVFTFKTVNAGASWLLISSMPSSLQPCSLFFTSALTGSMILQFDGIYKTTDGGITWVPKLTTSEAQYLHALDFPSSNIGYAVGDDSVFKTTDVGETWTSIAVAGSIGYNAVHFTNIDTGYAGGGNGFSTGAIRKTVDGGITWTLSNTNPYTFQSICFPKSNTGYACGQSGIIYKIDVLNGIQNLTDANSISVYPNPGNGRYSLSVDQLNPGLIYRISVLDVLGNLIQQTEMSGTSLDIDISNRLDGIYFVKIENEDGTIMKKVVKQ